MSIEPLRVEYGGHGGLSRIATVVLEQPGRPVVVIDHDLLRRLDAALDTVADDAQGLILASASERVFVAGADLRAIHDLDDDQLLRYLEYAAGVFARLSRFPFPTVAAINGAALGGGLEIAMHCDGLVGAPSPSGKPYPVGLPEAGLSICPGWGGTNLLPARIDPAEAIRRTAVGKPFTVDEAADLGLFDHVAERAEDLIDACRAWIAEQPPVGRSGRDGAPRRWIGRPETAPRALGALDDVRSSLPDTSAAHAVAECVDVGLSAGWDAAIDAERRHLTRLRHTPPARQAIRDFFEKSARK